MSLSTIVELRDGMSRVLNTIGTSLQAVNERFAHMNEIANQAGSSDAFSDMRSDLVRVQDELTRATSEVQDLRRQLEETEPPANELVSTLKKVGAAFVGSKLVSSLVSASDTMAQTTARLNLMNDGLQTTEELQQQIYESAQRSRGAYNDTADAVAKMGLLAGDAFSNNQEIIAFVEQLNKQFTIAGTSAEGQAAAMLQLTQAMGSGVLRGEELNSVFEQAPTIIQSIAEYLGVSVGEIRSMAQEGELTASVVKNALLASAEETNEKFESMAMTWSDVWTSFSNTVLMLTQPILEAINWLANNISIIIPLVVSLGAAFAVLAIAYNWTTICTAATRAWAAAQAVLNAVMNMNPIVLIITAIITLIGVIAAVIAYTNKTRETTISVVGVITGAIAVAATAVYNTVIGVINAIIQAAWTVFAEPFVGIVEWVVNVANGGFNSFGDAVKNLIGQIISWLLSLGKVATKIIDAIFGTDWTYSLSSLQDTVLAWGKNDTAITFDRSSAPTLSRKTYSSSWSSGYNFGSNLGSGVSSALGLASATGTDLTTVAAASSPTTDLLTDIADNTSQIADDVSVSSEELELLRNLAERSDVNKYTNATIRIEMTNNNSISGTDDIDGIVDALESKLVDALVETSEGVHF